MIKISGKVENQTLRMGLVLIFYSLLAEEFHPTKHLAFF